MAITDIDKERILHFEKKPIPKYPYWYGMKDALYTMVGLPNWMPVSCHLQHGAATIFRSGRPDSLILSTPYPVIFLSNKEQYDYCKSFEEAPITKPIHIIGSLFPRYRKFKGIERSPNAKGSLVFVGHSSKTIEVKSDWDELVEQFMSLPEQYHPLTVSIYFIDYLRGVHKPFLEAGFDVVTAGHISDPQFIDNFYKILPEFNYVISTDIGSHLYYSIEMDIPFFIYGTQGTYHKHGKDANALADEYKITEFEKFAAIYRIFTPTTEEIQNGVTITPAQKAFVEDKIGVKEALPLDEIKTIIQEHQKGFYLKELALSPIKLPLNVYRNLKAKITS